MRERTGHARELTEELLRGGLIVGSAVDDTSVTLVIPMGVDPSFFRNEPVLVDFTVHIKRQMPL